MVLTLPQSSAPTNMAQPVSALIHFREDSHEEERAYMFSSRSSLGPTLGLQIKVWQLDPFSVSLYPLCPTLSSPLGRSLTGWIVKVHTLSGPVTFCFEGTLSFLADHRTHWSL